MGKLADKLILITGGGSGLGQASAIKAAKEGAKLSLVDLYNEGLEDTKKKVQDAVPEAEVQLIMADVSDEETVKNYVDETVQTYDRIDGFFNNAGIEGKKNLTSDFGSDDFQEILNINLNGVFYGLKYVLRVMEKQGFGSVVNTTSVVGIRGTGNQPGYAASKHGIVGLTRNAGVEYGEYGIRINAIAPGPIMTPLIKASLKPSEGESWEEAGKDAVRYNPMKRFGKPEEVANLVSFLLSDESGFINAAVIPIDGGQSNKF